MGKIFLITGGSGFVGLNLAVELGKNSANRVRLLDLYPPCLQPICAVAKQENVEFFQGDLSTYESICRAFVDVHCVFHLASFGMSGREMLLEDKINAVNISGTHNVIKACLDFGVEELVYTSTFNVVFHGQVIENGDESLPYSSLEQHCDHYSRTKIVAEQAILAANDMCSREGRVLHTCALRLAGIYGPHETRHLPRAVSNIRAGLFRALYGLEEAIVEFVHVKNVVHALILASRSLAAENNSVSAGQTYFISDGKPIGNFAFFKPLVEGLGHQMPRLKLPLWLVYYTAFMIELFHRLVSPLYNFQPLLTRAEVLKTGVTHYFNLEKAERDLGYKPLVQNDLSQVIEEYKIKCNPRTVIPNRAKSYLFDVILGVLITIVIVSFLPLVS